MGRWLSFAAVAAVTAIAYLPSVSDAFVPFDDGDYVSFNEHMRDGLTPGNARWAFTSCGYASNWHPLAWLSLMADVTVSRGRELPQGEWEGLRNRVARTMRTHNVILHAINAALLFLLMRLVCRGRLDDRWILALALLWALHPLRTEVPCWISERKELLSVMFMLLTLVFWVRRPPFGYPLSLLSFALALLAKPVAVTLPAVLVAWDLIAVGRVRVLRTIPYALMALLTCRLTMAAQAGAITCGTDWGPVMRWTAILGSPLIYIRQTFWPFGLSAAYATERSLNWFLMAGGGAFVLVLAAVCAVWLVRRLRSPGTRQPILDCAMFTIAWSYVGLIPMLGIVKVGWQSHSDRYTYWVGCGVCVGLAMLLAEKGHAWWDGVVRWIERVDGRPFDRAKARQTLFWGALGVAAVLGFASWQRMAVWRDPFAFMGDTLGKSWNVDFAEVTVNRLLALGPRYEGEAEGWLRQCATENPCDRSYILLARFLVRKELRCPPPSGLENPEDMFVEAAGLAGSVLAGNPDNVEAKDIVEGIEDARRKIKGEKPCTGTGK